MTTSCAIQFIIFVSMIQLVVLHFSHHEKDFIITVKTTSRFHSTRLNKIYNSWFQDDPNNIYFITDKANLKWKHFLGERIVTTSCPHNHSRNSLCCKMNAELHTFNLKNTRFFCHFDDDNVVNIQNLRKFLKTMDSNKPLYLGKSSTEMPIIYKEIPFRFATGGAGFCISNGLMRLVLDYIDNVESFESICKKISFPDDVTLGYLIETVLQTPFQNVELFHSHLPYDHLVENKNDVISIGSL